MAAPSIAPVRRAHPLDRASTLFVGIAAALWVSDAYFRPSLVQQHLSGSQIVLLEDALISLCFVPLLFRVGRTLGKLSARKWLALVVIGVGPQALATVLFTNSLSYVFKGGAPDLNIQNEVYLLYLLQPVFAVAMARIFLKEKRKPYFWPLAAIALAGVYLIVFPVDPLAPFSSLQHGQLTAALLVLGAVALWAAGTVLGRYALEDVPFLTITAMRFLIALPVLFVLALIDSGSGGFGAYSFGQLPSFIAIALVPGFIAMLLYYRALSSTPASMATFAELAYPATLFLVFSLPVAYGGFGLPFHLIEVIGVVMLVFAVTALNLLKHKDVVEEPRAHELRLAAEAGG